MKKIITLLLMCFPFYVFATEEGRHFGLSACKVDDLKFVLERDEKKINIYVEEGEWNKAYLTSIRIETATKTMPKYLPIKYLLDTYLAVRLSQSVSYIDYVEWWTYGVFDGYKLPKYIVYPKKNSVYVQKKIIPIDRTAKIIAGVMVGYWILFFGLLFLSWCMMKRIDVLSKVVYMFVGNLFHYILLWIPLLIMYFLGFGEVYQLTKLFVNMPTLIIFHFSVCFSIFLCVFSLYIKISRMKKRLLKTSGFVRSFF